MSAVIIPCPICKKDVPMDSPEMPFCSERCRIADLANWADERYVFSTPASVSISETDLEQ